MRMIAKGRSLFFAAFLLLLTHAYAAPQTAITGEIVETFCWAKVQVGGPPHASCGIECAKRGIPVAIVEKKTRKAYVLLPGRDKTALPPALIQAMGHQVTIQGEIYAKGGTQFMTVQAWQRVK